MPIAGGGYGYNSSDHLTAANKAILDVMSINGDNLDISKKCLRVNASAAGDTASDGCLSVFGSDGGNDGTAVQSWLMQSYTDNTLYMQRGVGAAVASQSYTQQLLTSGALIRLKQPTAPASGLTNQHSATLADNTGVAADVDATNAAWSQALYSNTVLCYNMERGSERSAGLLILNLEGTTTNVYQIESHSDVSSPPLGVTFTAVASGGVTELKYTTTSTGSAATFKWFELMRV